MPTHVTEFAVTIAVLVVLPGAAGAVIIRQTLMYGRSAGLLTVAGVALGVLTWGTVAAVGLSAVGAGHTSERRAGGHAEAELARDEPVLHATQPRRSRRAVRAPGYRCDPTKHSACPARVPGARTQWVWR